MKISAIVARSTNNIIGQDNKLPWHLPGDLDFFRRKTMGHHVIMGRKSFESLPGPLKGRTIIMVTRNKEYYDSLCVVTHSIAEALAYAKEKDVEEVFILGGGVIYELTKNIWDTVYITDVEVKIKGDTSFIDMEYNKWILEAEEPHHSDEKNAYNYTFRTYTRVK